MYEVKVYMQIKTMGIKLSHSQMAKIIKDSIDDHPDIRDVIILDFDGDTEEDSIINFKPTTLAFSQDLS